MFNLDDGFLFALKLIKITMLYYFRVLEMNNNFEEKVFYFIVLVFNNIQVARTRKNKTKAVFLNLKVNDEEITIFNKEKNYSYTLCKKQIQDFAFEQQLIKDLALIYIDKLTQYLNKKITFEELADIKEEATPPIVKKLLGQKNNISEQLSLLRKNSNIPEVQKYIDDLCNYKYLTDYMKYLIDRYYYNIKGLPRPKKNALEKMFKLLLR